MPDLAAQVAGRYRGASRWARGFIEGKLRRDPAVAALLALGGARGFGRVLDLGCGRGQLGIALLLAGVAQSLRGLDIDAGKIALAQDAAHGLPAEFRVADLATPEALPAADTVLLIDVLLQLPPPAQDALLARILAVRPRRILLRAFDPDRGWRSALGSGMERMRRRLGGDRGLDGTVAPRPIDALAAPLEAAGYTVSVTPCWAGTPLPNVLLVAQCP
jgi:SAM-dependent methyltransferase